jgi:hypothetical protein
VTLGQFQAYRYASLQPKGSSSVFTVYVVPTSAGVATLACQTGAGATAVLRACDQIAGTLRLAGAKAYPLGPSPASGQLLSGTFGRLRNRASAAAQRLRAATTPAAQADAAAALAQAYGGAASDLSQSPLDPVVRDANSALTAALRQLTAAYARAAAAARGGSAGGYSGAARDISRGAAALGAALQSVRGLGYNLSG